MVGDHDGGRMDPCAKERTLCERTHENKLRRRTYLLPYISMHIIYLIIHSILHRRLFHNFFSIPLIITQAPVVFYLKRNPQFEID